MKQHFRSVACQRIRDEIVTTARNGAGAQDEIGTGMAGLGQCRIEGSIVVAHLPTPHDIGAGGTQPSQQITAGAVADLARLQRLCGVADQLASRGNQGHARSPQHLHLRAAQAGEQHQMRTAQYGAGIDHAIVQAHVFAATTDVLARTHRPMQADAAGALAVVFEDLHLLDRHHRIGTRGTPAPVMISQAAPIAAAPASCPAATVPLTTCSLSANAPMPAVASANPSIALLSKGGNSAWLDKASASTRPSASSLATHSLDRVATCAWTSASASA